MRPLFPLALLLALPVPALAQWTSGIHDTGVVRFEVFDNGKLGAFGDGTGAGTIGEGFVFEGENGLWEGAFVVGQDLYQVSGDIWDFPDLEWVTVAPVSAVSPPPGFDEAYEATYDDSGAPNSVGLEITQTTYTRDGDPFIIAGFRIENTSGNDLDDLYVGVTADWVIGTWWSNRCNYNEEAQLVYCWDTTGANTNYHGVAALDLDLLDVTVTGVDIYLFTGDPHLYGALTTIHLPPLTIPAGSTLIGIGPFDLAAGEAQRTVFVYVAGASEAELLANAEAAQCLILSECPSTASEPTTTVPGVTLHPAAPNPSRGGTALSFTLDRPLPVRLSVHDTLGREVAVLVDEARGAGEHEVTWEAAGLPAGVYVVRVAGEAFAVTRRVVLVR